MAGRSAFLLFVFAFSLLIVFSQIGRIDGILNPPLSRVDITDVEDRGSTVWIWGTYEDFRGCNFRWLEWYPGESPRGHVTLLQYGEAERIRGNLYRFGPIELQMPLESFQSSRAVIGVRCWPWFDTESRFY